MKVLMINGSPHEHGCTFTALSEVAATLAKNGVESEIYHIGRKPLQGCVSCFKCFELGRCVFSDSVNDLAARLGDFSGIIVGSPVYYAAPSGNLCAFLDRLFFSSDSAKLEGKPAACVVSCRRGGASAAFDRLNKYFTIRNMIVIGSQYWNQVHGNTPEEVRQDIEGLQTMRTLGENFAWVMKCIEAGKIAGINYPVHEETLSTNFIR